MPKLISKKYCKVNNNHLSRRFGLVVVVAIAFSIPSSDSQSIQAAQAPQSHAQEQSDEPEGVKKIKETLERLQTESERLQKTLSTSADRLSMPESSDGGDAADPLNKLRDMSADLEEQTSDYRTDAGQIYRQIQLIKEIMQSAESSPELYESPIGELDGRSGMAGESQQSAPSVDTAALFGSGKNRLPAQLPTTKKNPNNITSVSLNPVRVLPEAIDLFEMGNSLFVTSEVSAALKAYSSVDVAKLNAVDSIWLEYLNACCNRTLSDLDTAESIYRQVSNENAHGELVSMARWWLNQIGRKKMANETYGEFESEFEMLMERVGNYAPGKSK